MTEDIDKICAAAAQLREAMREAGLDGTISINVHMNRDQQALNAMLSRAGMDVSRRRANEPDWICDVNGIPFYAVGKFRAAHAYKRSVDGRERFRGDD